MLAVLGPACRCGFESDPGVKIIVPAMPTTLDWNVSDPTSWTNYPVILATMQGLTQVSPEGEIQPALAERWERQIQPNGQELYTFHLRGEATWSDGRTPITASDFVLGWRRAVQGKERGEMTDLSGAHEVLRLLEAGASADQIRAAVQRLGVEAVDSRTVRVTLSRPRNYFLARAANVYLFFPAPSADLLGKSEERVRDYFDRPRDGKPMATGPFRVDRWDRSGERVRLAAVGSQERRPKVVTLMKSEIGSALYSKGRVGFVFVDSASALQQERPSDLTREELLSTYLLFFNTQRPPLDRPAVRRALAMALDRQSLVHGLLPAARVAATLLPPRWGIHSRPLPRLDVDEAARVLKSAGRVDRPLRLVFRGGESFIPEVAIAERLRAQFARLGVQVELDPRYDFAVEIARMAPDGFHAPDLYLKRIGADYAHPKTFFTLFEEGGNHCTGWEKIEGGAALRRFESLLDQGDARPDIASGAAFYQQAEEILLSEQVVIAPIYHPDRYYRVSANLLNLGVDPFNFLSLRNLKVR